MNCLDISGGGEMICPAPTTPIGRSLTEPFIGGGPLPHTGIDWLPLLLTATLLVLAGLIVLAARSR